MSSSLRLLFLINFLWLIYLTYLIYQRRRSNSSQSTPSSSNKKSESSGENKAITKFAILRFNPFNDLGGDQSFVLALLDKSNSGVIITSLHSRSQTRVYAKGIKNGTSPGLSLSKEEKAAINKAIINNN